MSILQDPYYDRPEASNSDLGAIQNYWMPQAYIIDLEQAYRFGSLVDAMITEPDQVDYYKHTVAGVAYQNEEFAKAAEMKKIFFNDAFCKKLAAQCALQKVSIKHNFKIEYNGFSFFLDVRAKWDFFAERIDLAGDLKTTASLTQKQFEQAIFHYNYDRQAAFYMDIENKSNFIFIGISKKNGKIFKVVVKRGDAIYNSGKEKYQELAFRYWYLFGNVNEVVL
jgi:hypothetical protein